MNNEERNKRILGIFFHLGPVHKSMQYKVGNIERDITNDTKLALRVCVRIVSTCLNNNASHCRNFFLILCYLSISGQFKESPTWWSWWQWTKGDNRSSRTYLLLSFCDYDEFYFPVLMTYFIYLFVCLFRWRGRKLLMPECLT